MTAPESTSLAMAAYSKTQSENGRTISEPLLQGIKMRTGLNFKLGTVMPLFEEPTSSIFHRVVTYQNNILVAFSGYTQILLQP